MIGGRRKIRREAQIVGSGEVGRRAEPDRPNSVAIGGNASGQWASPVYQEAIRGPTKAATTAPAAR